MASSQRRCVFVGNIPYDATEEQLIQICEEVGPVVSFRLVIDRETGKPKGYGFCEYKDEETALSARRNLQGYEINGRQLRVDFAENDKNSDRNREQGRGGPGMSSDSQKHVAGPAVLGDSVQHQPIGLHSAITAAAVVAGALGASQGMKQNQNGLPAQTALVNDPLTLHLAKLSRSQLTDVMSELKMMATHNLESARKLLLARPQLAKAIFQAEIMLGMVTPQMLQMLSARQVSGQFLQPSLQDGQQSQLPAGQNLPGLHAIPQSTMQSGTMPKFPEAQVSAVPQSLIQNQGFATQQPPMRLLLPIPQDTNVRAFHPSLSANSGVSNLPSGQIPSSTNMSVRPPILVANPASVNQQIRPPSQQLGGSAVANLGHSTQSVVPNAAMQTSVLPHTYLADHGPQTSSSVVETSQPTQLADAAAWARRSNAISDQVTHPSKLLRMEDGSGTPLPAGNLNVINAPASGPIQVPGAGTLPYPANKTEAQTSDKQAPQLAPEIESALLQQVLNLTPEQLSLLSPEQQQQVIQLQQALRRGEFQP